MKYEGYHDDLYHYKFQVIDTDFSEQVIGATAVSGSGESSSLCASAAAMVNCYSNRSLNVPLNLYLYHKDLMEAYSWYNIEKEISWNILNVPRYNEYVEETRRYLKRFNNLKAFW